MTTLVLKLAFVTREEHAGKGDQDRNDRQVHAAATVNWRRPRLAQRGRGVQLLRWSDRVLEP
jgi:hypothetical protein